MNHAWREPSQEDVERVTESIVELTPSNLDMLKRNEPLEETSQRASEERFAKDWPSQKAEPWYAVYLRSVPECKSRRYLQEPEIPSLLDEQHRRSVGQTVQAVEQQWNRYDDIPQCEVVDLLNSLKREE